MATIRMQPSSLPAPTLWTLIPSPVAALRVMATFANTSTSLQTSSAVLTSPATITSPPITSPPSTSYQIDTSSYVVTDQYGFVTYFNQPPPTNITGPCTVVLDPVWVEWSRENATIPPIGTAYITVDPSTNQTKTSESCTPTSFTQLGAFGGVYGARVDAQCDQTGYFIGRGSAVDTSNTQVGATFTILEQAIGTAVFDNYQTSFDVGYTFRIQWHDPGINTEFTTVLSQTIDYTESWDTVNDILPSMTKYLPQLSPWLTTCDTTRFQTSPNTLTPAPILSLTTTLQARPAEPTSTNSLIGPGSTVSPTASPTSSLAIPSVIAETSGGALQTPGPTQNAPEPTAEPVQSGSTQGVGGALASIILGGSSSQQNNPAPPGQAPPATSPANPVQQQQPPPTASAQAAPTPANGNSGPAFTFSPQPTGQPAVVIGSSATLIAGAVPTMISGQTISVPAGQNSVVVVAGPSGTSTVPLAALSSAIPGIAPAIATTVTPSPLQQTQITALDLGNGRTLLPGAMTVIAGQIISLPQSTSGQQAVVVDGATVPLAALSTVVPGAHLTTFTGPAPLTTSLAELVQGSLTLFAGASATVIDGHTVSLLPSGAALVVDGTTVPVAQLESLRSLVPDLAGAVLTTVTTIVEPGAGGVATLAPGVVVTETGSGLGGYVTAGMGGLGAPGSTGSSEPLTGMAASPGTNRGLWIMSLGMAAGLGCMAML